MPVIVADEDYTVPQTGAGQAWLRRGGAITLDPPGMVVLADVVALLGEAEDTLDHPRDMALYVCERLRTLYGLTYLHVAA
jgi:hypothetical protein